VAVVLASLFEIVPTFLIRSNVPTIASVQPYSPLELMGRDIYVSEGCYNCHSQMVRPILPETKRYGEYSKPGEFVNDHPFQWGSRRIGPDLAREGVTKSSMLWQYTHLQNPQLVTPGSVMPKYVWLSEDKADFRGVGDRVKAMYKLGTPYLSEVVGDAEALAKAQAARLAADLEKQAIEAGENATGLARQIQDKQSIALMAYLLRLGTDLGRPWPTDPAAQAPLARALQRGEPMPAAKTSPATQPK
jgi:cytochrome c oxidase cbb3-type subunit I/II